jgi:hypothetical protein
MDEQDRMAALDKPSSSQVLAASYHIFPVVFNQSFNFDTENVGFAVSADVGSAL